MLDLGNGDFQFVDSLNLLLKTKALLGQSWTFNPDYPITATITNMYTQEVFGEPDSLKTISLSNGDSIIISKEHGILQFPEQGMGYYYLEGIEGRDLGIVTPKFDDYFDFNIGDEFYYQTASYASQNGGENHHYKQVILNKESFEDSVRYTVRRYGYYSPIFSPNTDGINDWPQYYYDYNTTLTYINSDSHIANAYNNRLVEIPSSIANPDFTSNGNYFVVKMKINDDGLIKKYGGNEIPIPPYNGLMYRTTEHDDILYSLEDSFHYGIQENSGLYQREFSTLNHSNSRLLNSSVINGDTTGTMPPEIFFLTSKTEAKNTIRIYPNPAQDVVNIELPSHNHATIKIYTSEGKLIQEFEGLGTTQTINTSRYIPGIYIVKVIFEDDIYTNRIVIKK
jgi:hypothetical protein